MRKLFFGFLFLMIGSFCFAGNNIHEKNTPIKASSEKFNLNELEDNGFSLIMNESSRKEILKFDCVACEIDFDIVNASTGTVVGSFTVTVEVCGGTPSSQQSACEWTGRVLQGLLNMQ